MSVPVAPWRTRAPPELLADRADHEAGQREAQPGAPDAHSERGDSHTDGNPHSERKQQLIAQVRESPSGARPAADRPYRQKENQSDRRHPFIEEWRADRESLAGDRLAQRQEHRREYERENRRIQLLTRNAASRETHASRLIARPKQRQSVYEEAEADRRCQDREAGEHPGRLPVLAERVHRLNDAGPGHERAEDRPGKNVTITSATFQTRSMPRRSCTITECRKAVAVNHGSSPAFSTGSHIQ